MTLWLGRGASKLPTIAAAAPAGAAAVTSAEFYVKLGVKRENITLTDLYGVVYPDRPEDMDRYKGAFAAGKQKGTLIDVIARDASPEFRLRCIGAFLNKPCHMQRF